MDRFPLVQAFLAAILFAAATPASKALLEDLSAFQLAGLLYLGAAVGTLPWAARARGFPWPWLLDSRTRRNLLGAMLLGGVAGPVLLLMGLRMASAASVSLLLNLELVATVLLGQFVFQDHLTRYGWAAAAGMLVAATLLAAGEGWAGLGASLLVASACVCWGADNHLTAMIHEITPSQTTFWKGLVAGITNLVLAAALQDLRGTSGPIAMALVVGSISYGLSIALYVSSARGLGAARSQIVFSIAPFFGMILAALFLAERISALQLGAALVMGISILFLYLEQHAHRHRHEATAHEHWHRHDEGHHGHFLLGVPHGLYHSHPHRHKPVSHEHSHWPGLEHRHPHRREGGKESEG